MNGTLIPPEPPALVALGDDDGAARLRMRLHQVSWSAITVFATAWCCTLGTVPALLALAVAKHVLVAILVMGLGVDADRRNR
ncbi:MAG: hypothetical protein U0746_11505 [Gemmataceae bacterium]